MTFDRYDEFDEIVMDMSGYRYPDIVQEYNDAWKRIKTPGEKRTPYEGKRIRNKRNSELVLESAHKMYSVGDVASPTVIANAIGISRQSVQNLITGLRRIGQWPFIGGYGAYGRKRITFGMESEQK